jgi:hypothetical protein
MANTQFPKSLYRVYECQDVNDCFSYNPDVILFESDNLGEAHTLAWTKWKLSLRTKAYTVIQPYDDSCRGGYGAWADAADAE